MRTRLLGTLTAVLALSFISLDASARPIRAKKWHSVAVTISPLLAMSGIVEVTGEVRIKDSVGIAAVLGGGAVVADSPEGGQDTYAAAEAGAQLRFYLFGRFDHGMQVGAEVLYVYLSRRGSDPVSVTAEGVAVGPFIGYKIATRAGFTFDAQVGVQYAAFQGRAFAAGATMLAEESGIIPLLNLNLGWSF